MESVGGGRVQQPAGKRFQRLPHDVAGRKLQWDAYLRASWRFWVNFEPRLLCVLLPEPAVAVTVNYPAVRFAITGALWHGLGLS